ncbi:hypothetical protein BSY238_2659 [Methyloversatilis sp. RAC08]|uniref:DUF4824 family protein n=1 Tax=Methyloversatilis sp. RAC08 TaxID=1842540 RepID=UPI00083E6904|nr:DUF4824 family protein [Methyloversatilis sp. RAC08]AOF80666.1 hypothetical protein BSY238_2659 [Methyloversatilis sp. RAC08]
MRRAQKVLLAGGVALIVAVNAFVLAGVAWNRSGAPGSALTLTQRELSLPYAFGFDGERGGIDVALLWRAPMRDDNADASYDMHYGRGPDWLGADKLRELGFDLKDERDAYREKREVYVVLELAGEAWQRALSQAQRRLDRALARGSADKQDADALKAAQEALKYEQDKASRLFAVDAGRDAAALRQRHPDPRRYAIVAATVTPSVTVIDKQTTFSGHIGEPSVARISMPYALRGAMDGVDRMALDSGRAAFDIDVAWGRRFEPWITAVRARTLAPVAR